MPFSYYHRVTFIHIPKTGGSSIEKALGIVTSDKWGTVRHLEDNKTSFFSHNQHLTFLQIRRHHKDWLQSSDLILVSLRDPLERIYSHFIARNGQWLQPNKNHSRLSFYWFVFLVLPLIRFSTFFIGRATRIFYSQYEHIIPQHKYLKGLNEFAIKNSKKVIYVSLFNAENDKIENLLSSVVGTTISIPHLRKSKSASKISKLRTKLSDAFIHWLYKDDYKYLRSISMYINVLPFN